MVKRLVFFFCIAFPLLSAAQYEQMAGVFVPPDSAREFTLFFRLGRAQSLIENRTVVLNSLRGGFEIDKRFRTGLLVAVLQDSVLIKERLPEGAAYNMISLAAIGAFVEFMVVNNYRWEMSVPIQVGSGYVTYNYLDSNKVKLFSDNEPYYYFLDLGFNFQYNFNNWAGFGVGFGVRTTTSSDYRVSKYTRGPYYMLGFRFSIGGLYNSVFHKDLVMERKNRYFEARRIAKENRK